MSENGAKPKVEKTRTFDLKPHIADNRLIGLIKMMKGYKWLYTGAIITLMISSVLNTARFFVLQRFVDDILPTEGDNLLGVLVGIALIFVALAIFQGYFTFLSGKWSAETAEGLAQRVKDYLFDHLQRLNFTYHDNMQTGELIQRCTSDVDAIRRFFSEQALGVGRILMLFGVNVIALIVMDWRLAILSVLVIPFVVLLSVYFFRRVSAAWDEFQAQEARLSTALQENLSGIRVVKAFNRQAYEIDKFEKENIEKYRIGKDFTKMHAMFWPFLDVITGAQLVFGYLVAGMFVIDGSITIGTYLAYMFVVVWIIFPIRNLGRLIVQMSTGLVSYDRVAEIIREDREYVGQFATPPAPAIRGDFVFDNVSFEYDATSSVLHNISFSAKAGETIALLGSTGSGKTSMLALLPRFYDYTSGSIKLDGLELREYPRYFLRKNIGIVEQEPFLFSRNIRENIRLGVEGDVSQEQIEAAARAAAVHDVIMSFPEGYDTLVGERGVTLSGGQKQRVALARTLLKDPKILILDDATSSVDTETESDIREALRRLMKGRTSFIIAHRIQSVMGADQILVLDKGKIVQRGKHEELMQDADGMYRRIYDMQARIEAELEREIASVG